MIKINYDFVSGKELSYIQAKEAGDNFETNCLDFFSFDYLEQGVIVFKENGDHIIMRELLDDCNYYTSKQIRKEHNILRLLKSGAFKWKQIKQTR